MSKYTTSPWKWQEGNPSITTHWNGADCTIATVAPQSLAWHEDSNCAGREAGANARLIAAAPELLEALKTSPCPIRVNQTVMDCVNRKHCGCDNGAAIAKATGVKP